MFDCPEEFSDEQIGKIREIIQTDYFREINSITNICDMNQEEEKIIKNIKDYIWNYLSHNRSSEFFSDVNYFLSFIENYQNKKRPEFTLPSSTGKLLDLKSDLLVICNGYHIHHNYDYLKPTSTNGLYMKETYLGSDHKLYLSKKSMKSNNLNVSDDAGKEVDYNSILAESIFRYFSQPVAKYYLLKNNFSPFNSILTPNFLENNQELIHLVDFYAPNNVDFLDTHTYRLNLIKDNLTLRYKGKMPDNELEQMLEKIQLQYVIQTFLKLLIGPMDINYGNTALILTNHNIGIPSIDIAPAYDLDISFNVANELNKNMDLAQVSDLNGQPVAIMSLINEFKDIPGFKDFLDEVINKISSHDIAEEVLNEVFQRTNFNFFKERKVSYANFLNKRFLEVIKAYKAVYLKEDLDETKTILGR